MHLHLLLAFAYPFTSVVTRSCIQTYIHILSFSASDNCKAPVESSPGLAPYPSTHLPATFGPSGQREKRLQSNLSIRTADALGSTENRIY